jgi:hypothetical protein
MASREEHQEYLSFVSENRAKAQEARAKRRETILKKKEFAFDEMRKQVPCHPMPSHPISCHPSPLPANR